MPLVCFCYGGAAWEEERRAGDAGGQEPAPFAARSLAELSQKLAEARQQREERLQRALQAVPRERLQRQEEERFLGLRLYTAQSERFAGQYVEEDGRLVYASLAATPRYLDA